MAQKRGPGQPLPRFQKGKPPSFEDIDPLLKCCCPPCLVHDYENQFFPNTCFACMGCCVYTFFCWKPQEKKSQVIKQELTDCKQWTKKNWCLVTRVVLAIIGCMVPLIMALMPCEDKISTVTTSAPVDVAFLLDRSGSMSCMIDSAWDDCTTPVLDCFQYTLLCDGTIDCAAADDMDEANCPATDAEKEAYRNQFNHMPTEIDASLLMMEEFHKAVDDLRMGWYFFSDNNNRVDNENFDVTNYTQNAIDSFRSHKASQGSGGRGGTQFELPLGFFIDDAETSLTKRQNSTVIKVAVLIGDGQANDLNDEPVPSQVEQIRNEGWLVLGILVTGNIQENQRESVAIGMRDSVSTCGDLNTLTSFGLQDSYQQDSCPFFSTFTTFSDLEANAASFIDQFLVFSEREVQEVTCEKGPWLGFLLLLLPFLGVLLLQLFLKRNKKKRKILVRKDKKDTPLNTPPPVPPTQQQGLPKAPVQKRKYKHEIKAATAYNRGTGGKIAVDYGAYQPPSAPHEDLTAITKREVLQWEEPDGYDYELITVEDDQTLEEFFESKFAQYACCRTCCCCCIELEKRASIGRMSTTNLQMEKRDSAKRNSQRSSNGMPPVPPVKNNIQPGGRLPPPPTRRAFE